MKLQPTVTIKGIRSKWNFCGTNGVFCRFVSFKEGEGYEGYSCILFEEPLEPFNVVLKKPGNCSIFRCKKCMRSSI
jgi:hypothetical protein